MLGIKPWQWALLTVEEVEYVIQWIDDYHDQIDKANRK